MHLKLISTVALVLFCFGTSNAEDNEEARAKVFMVKLNNEFQTRRNTEENASWDYASNITDKNLKKRNEISSENAEFIKVSDQHRSRNR
jgi:hypothetical protein